MLEVTAAREIVLSHVKRLAAEVSSAPLGRVLAEDVTADLDSPPFDKSMMDGYAVRAVDCAAGATLRVIEEIAAGGQATKNVGPGEATRVFTGAPIPPGADAVVKQEDVTATADAVTIPKPVKPGQNVFRRGQEMRAGQVVIPSGELISPAAVGVLAAVGRTSASVIPAPRVCVLVTGNELVGAGEVPTGGQIRNTNGPMLLAQAARAGAIPHDLGIARDDVATMATLVRQGLEASHVLLLSGGVSVGKYDLVPDVLKSLGVEIRFHQVRMKPGKPLLFGTRGDKLVFGLPGNPVSAYLGFELFVRPAIGIMSGRDTAVMERRLPLTEPLKANHDRPTYHPAVVGGDGVRPLPWSGSADLKGLRTSNGFVVLPPGEVNYPAGQVVDVVVTE